MRALGRGNESNGKRGWERRRAGMRERDAMRATERGNERERYNESDGEGMRER